MAAAASEATFLVAAIFDSVIGMPLLPQNDAGPRPRTAGPQPKWPKNNQRPGSRGVSPMTTGPTFWLSILPEPDQGSIQARRRPACCREPHVAGRKVDARLGKWQGGRLDDRARKDLHVHPGGRERRLELQADRRASWGAFGEEVVLAARDGDGRAGSGKVIGELVGIGVAPVNGHGVSLSIEDGIIGVRLRAVAPCAVVPVQMCWALIAPDDASATWAPLCGPA